MADRITPVVHTAGLCKTFRDFWRRPRVEAVKDLDLEIRPGEVFGLLGPNGSGKTTTIKMLLGLLYPTRGRISVLGKSPSDVAVKARIGFLPEESYLYRFLVAEETLDFYGRLFQLPRKVRKDRIDRLLDMVGLKHEATRRMGEYSKGMARRIGLAQALINDPEFLILDEPTSGLDPIGARQIKDVIRALGKKGKTILLSSHVLSDVEDVCDRVTILYGGQQRAIGEVNDLLLQQDITQFTTPALSDDTIEKLQAVLNESEQKQILSISNPRIKLEDYFLQIVHEAQAANIRTSGARAGGDLPEFLQLPTRSDTEETVDSLMAAATPALQFPPDPPPVRDRAEPGRQIIEELVETAGTARQPAEDAGDDAPKEPASESETADDSVIKSLISRADDKDDKDSKTIGPGS